MTVGKLEKILSQIKNKRMKVVVEKHSMNDGNGDWSVCEISHCAQDFIYISDGDGSIQVNMDGTEVGRTFLVIKGTI